MAADPEVDAIIVICVALRVTSVCDVARAAVAASDQATAANMPMLAVFMGA